MLGISTCLQPSLNMKWILFFSAICISLSFPTRLFCLWLSVVFLTLCLSVYLSLFLWMFVILCISSSVYLSKWITHLVLFSVSQWESVPFSFSLHFSDSQTPLSPRVSVPLFVFLSVSFCVWLLLGVCVCLFLSSAFFSLEEVSVL